MKLIDTAGTTNWKFIGIAVAIALLVTGGLFWYRSLLMQEVEEVLIGKGKLIHEQKQQEESAINNQKSKLDTSNWQTYRDEEHGFEFQYPDYLAEVDQGNYEFTARSTRSDWLRINLHLQSLNGFIYRAPGDESIAYEFDRTTDSWTSINPNLSSNKWAPKETQTGDLIYYSVHTGDGATAIEKAYVSHPSKDMFIEFITTRNGSWVDCIEPCPEEKPFSDKRTVHQILSTLRFIDDESELKPSQAESPASGVCPAPGDDEFAHITFKGGDNIPTPRCLKVMGDHKLQLTNTRNEPITATLGKVQMTIDPGETQTDTNTFSSYLAPGVHSISTSVPGVSAEIWLQP